MSHCFHVAINPVSAPTIVLHAAFRLPAGPEPAPRRQRALAVGEVDALCQTLTAQGSLADSLHQLRVWLQAQTGATQVRIGWYANGQVRLTTSEPACGSSQDEAWQAAMSEAIDQGLALCAPADTLPHMAEWVTRAQAQLARLAELAQSTQLASASSGAQACTLILPAMGPHAHPLGAISLVWPAHTDSLDKEKVLPIEIPKTAVTATASAEFGTVYDMPKGSMNAKTLSRARDAYDRMTELIEQQIEAVWASQVEQHSAGA